MLRKANLAVLAAIGLGVAAAPATAQRYSDSYTFLKAVKDRDGAKAESLLGGGGVRIINTKDFSTGDGAVHILARDRDLTWLSFLLGKGAKPDLQNKEGDTALLLATQLGWEDGVNLLLRRGAKVDLANSRGETPLILAVQKRDIVLVRLLLSKGADPRRPDRIAGYSALDYAKQDGRSAGIVKMLEEAKPVKPVSGPSL